MLTADIQLNDTSDWENWSTTAPANSWTAIGTNINSFKGIFDGQGHTISGVYINTSSNYQGLFGYCYGSTIKNVGVTKSYIKGGYRIGGVVGENRGTITNSYNTGTVSGKYYIGGVVGTNNSRIINCYNTGDASGTLNKDRGVGGVVGVSYGTITNSYNTGSVSGTSSVGGVVGSNMNTNTITNCYYLSGTASSGVSSGT